VDGTIIPKQAVAISMRQVLLFIKSPQCMSGLVAVVRDHYHQSGRYLAIKLLAREPHADQRQFEFQNVRPADGTTLPSIGGTAAGSAGSSLVIQLLLAFT
jgi:hypothetical protein